MGTKRSLGANPASASTSNATRSSSSKVSGTPIWLVLSVLLIGLAVTLSAGTDKFLCSPLGARVAVWSRRAAAKPGPCRCE
jgi:hypothetical protein